MTRFLAMLACVAVLSGCDQKAPTDTVDSLAANPERLKTLRAQCKADHAKVGDAVCSAVSEATRRRFMGDGKSPYADDSAPQSATKD